MTKEYAVEMIKAIKNGLHETGKDFPYRDEIIPIAKEALEMAITELEQEPLNVSNMLYDIYMEGVNMGGLYKGVWVRFRDIEKIVNKYTGGAE